MVSRSAFLPALIVLAFALAGCTTTDGEPTADSFFDEEDDPVVQATATTGGIRGVVVDDRITPIAGAIIEVVNHEESITTGDDGLFAISGLEPGTYLIKASHPLYTTAQQNTEVVAGEDNPPAVKLQLLRTVFAEPYLQTLAYEGFIVCSANVQFVGYSEECGEGAGVPGVGRVGGQDNNRVQFDFTVGAGAQTVIAEQVWEPTSDAGRAFYTPISTEWVCDPFCGGSRFIELDGPSPLRGEINATQLADHEVLPDETVITMFTWASLESNPVGVVLNQRFQNFVTVFYYLPAPEGWSFVGGSPNPYN